MICYSGAKRPRADSAGQKPLHARASSIIRVQLTRAYAEDYHRFFCLQSAERALSSHCGEETAARFISNAPSGFYKFKFPKGARRNSSVGAKLFIYNAFVPRADYSQATPTCTVIANRDKVLDYAWLAKDEMHRFLKPKYLSAVQQIMLWILLCV